MSGARIERWEAIATGVILAWFAARVAYLAVSLHPFVPPDEVTHFGRVLAYAKVWGVPESGPATFELGLLDHRPWLYYWAMARSLALDVFGLHPLVFARLVNGLLGLATVWVGILWVREWCASPWARVLFAALVTNVLMFTGLAASVSYDNATNLLAAAAVLAAAKLRCQRGPIWLLAFAAFVLAGCLTKQSFLPFAVLIVTGFGVREWRQIPAWLRQLRGAVRHPRAAALLLAVFLLGAFAATLYGENLLRYGRIVPGFDEIVGEHDAMENRIFARGRIVERFRDGEIRIDEARKLAGRIRHQGDRGDTLFLLSQAQHPEQAALGRLEYLPAWGRGMLRTSVSYLGHRRAVKSGPALLAYAVVLGFAALVLALRWRPGDARGIPADAATLVFGYALVLTWIVHYPAYQRSGALELALQGRYLFPVLVPLLGLVAWAIGERTPARIAPWLAALVAAGFAIGDLPWLLTQIDERWFMPL